MADCIFVTNDEAEAGEVIAVLEGGGIIYRDLGKKEDDAPNTPAVMNVNNSSVYRYQIFVNNDDVERAYELLSAMSADDEPIIEIGVKKSEADNPSLDAGEEQQNTYDRSFVTDSIMLSLSSFLIAPLIANIAYIRTIWKHNKATAVCLALLALADTIFFDAIIISFIRNKFF